MAKQHNGAQRVAWAIVPGVFLAGIGGGIVFPIIPIVGLAAHLSPALIGLILSANRMTRVIFNPWVGSLIDRYGGRRLLALGLLGEASIMGLYAYAVQSPWVGPLFLIARILWGPASALILVGGLTLALNAGNAASRGSAASIVRAAQSLGTPSGMVFGGILSGWIGDQGTFIIGSGAAVMAAGVSLKFIPHLLSSQGKPPRTWREVFGSLSQPQIRWIDLLNFISFAAVQGLLLATMVLMVRDRHLTWRHLSIQTMSGVLLAILLISAAAATPGAGKLVDRWSKRIFVAILGLTLMIGGFGILAIAHHLDEVVAGLVLTGAGMGSLNLPLLALLGDLVSVEHRGSAVGSFQLFGDAGGTLGPIIGVSAVAVWGITIPYLVMGTILIGGLFIAVHLLKDETSIMLNN